MSARHRPALWSERTPLPLPVERVRSVPPPAPSAAWGVVYEALGALLWLVGVACLVVVMAVVLLALAEAMAG